MKDVGVNGWRQCETPDRWKTAAQRFIRASCVLFFLPVGCGGFGSDESGSDGSSPAGESAGARPAVPDTRFTTLEGASVSLRDLEGSVLIVNFWGTWCVPCRREIPELVELHDHYADRGVEVIGIAVDSGEPEEIREFMDGYGVRYRLWTTGAVTALAEFGSHSYPFTLVVDRDGGVVSSVFGPQTVASMTSLIEPLLAAEDG